MAIKILELFFRHVNAEMLHIISLIQCSALYLEFLHFITCIRFLTSFNQAVLQGILNLKVLTFQECFDLMRMARDVLRLQKWPHYTHSHTRAAYYLTSCHTVIHPNSQILFLAPLREAAAHFADCPVWLQCQTHGGYIGVRISLLHSMIQ